MRLHVCSWLMCLTVLAWVAQAKAAQLIVDGKPKASIVMADDALPQVKFAASELQEHLEKITGVKLQISATPQDGLTPIYVGPGAAAAAGVKADDLTGESYRILVTDKHIVLAGHDENFPRYPRGHDHMNKRSALLKQWQEQTGHVWDLPWRNLYDPRNHSDKLGFSVYDPTGTLFAVYDLLEQLGVRWYAPYEHGTVLPEAKTITVKSQDTTTTPAFSHRYLWYSFANGDHEGFLWFKRQKLGMSQMSWYGHGVPLVTHHQKETHPEFFSILDGKLQNGGKGPGHPRLAPPLRDEMVRFADKVFTIFPELKYCPIAPADGYIRIDDRDAAAGWSRSDRGEKGKLSDYAWTFMNDVAKGVYKEHPDRIVMGLAYSSYQLMPRDVTTFSPNLGVGYCQNRASYSAETLEENAANRQAWMDAISSGEFFIWEYYLFDRVGDKSRGVPVFFAKVQQAEARSLVGKSKGEFIECSWGTNNRMANPATNHLTYYIQGKLFWNPDLDLEALIAEYCQQYFGPAAGQMRAFYQFAEDVWARPGSRDPYAADTFIKPEDIEQYFTLLAAAKARAGQSVYGQRIEAIVQECQPMKAIFPYQQAMADGKASAAEGDLEAAVKAYELAIEKAQNARHKAEAQLALGNLYRDQIKDDEQALQMYRAVMKQPISSRRAIQWGAMEAGFGVLRRQGKHEDALKILEYYDATSGVDYWQFVVLRGKGLIAADRQDRDQAIAYFEEAMKLKVVPPRMKEKLSEELAAIRN